MAATMMKAFFKAMASMAGKMEDDDAGGDFNALSGNTLDGAAGHSNRKLHIYTFVDGVEVRALCDGEKRGTFIEEPGLYYATATEIVALTREKADGTSMGGNKNRDRFRIEILLANTTSVAKMSLGRLMRDWNSAHPPKRTVRMVRRDSSETGSRTERRSRRKRRRTIYGSHANLPFNLLGPLSPRETAIVEHFRSLGVVGEPGQEPNRLQRNEHEGNATDSNADDEDSDESEEEEGEDEREDPGAEGVSAAESKSNEEGAQGLGAQQQTASSSEEDEDEGREEYREEEVVTPMPMTFGALAKEFIACFKNLEELSVKFCDDRVRQFPIFNYQHNPMTRLQSLRGSLLDLEKAHVDALGSLEAGETHLRNYFPASYVLSLYLKGFPDRFRDQINSAVTVDPSRYMTGWDDVLDRIEEMLGIWGKTSDVVYHGLLTQIKTGGSKSLSSDNNKNSALRRSRGGSSSQDWNSFVNSLQEDVSPKLEGRITEYDDEDNAPVSKAELRSIISAALANPNSVLQHTRDQDRGHHRRDRGQLKQHRKKPFSRNHQLSAGVRKFAVNGMTWEEAMRIARHWQDRMCKEGVPKDLKLCIWCHEWHFLHVPYGCPRDIRQRDHKAAPFNDFPASREAQSVLRVQDEEELRTYKQKHEGKTPREARSSLRSAPPRSYERRPSYGNKQDF
jgi:hypothetical protein